MGYTRRQRLLRVELPLAVPLILAGLRLASVTMIGLATVVAVLGDSFGGLGQLITEGLQTLLPDQVPAGCRPVGRARLRRRLPVRRVRAARDAVGPRAGGRPLMQEIIGFFLDPANWNGTLASRTGSSSTSDLCGLAHPRRHAHRACRSGSTSATPAAGRASRSTSRTSAGPCRRTRSLVMILPVTLALAPVIGYDPTLGLDFAADPHRDDPARDPADPRQRVRRPARGRPRPDRGRPAAWACASAQILRRIEIPLASPVIIGGFRTATLQVIATATIGAILAAAASAGSSSTVSTRASPVGRRSTPARSWSPCWRSGSTSSSRSSSGASRRAGCARPRGASEKAGGRAARRARRRSRSARRPRPDRRRRRDDRADHSLVRYAGDAAPAARIEEEDHMRTTRVLALGMRLLVLLAPVRRRRRHAIGVDRRAAPRRAAHRPARPRRRGQGPDPDRLGQLLRVGAHGRDLRPGPRERRLHGRAQVRARVAPGAHPDHGRGRGRPGARVRRLRPRLLRQDEDHRRRRRPTPPPSRRPSTPKGITVLGITPGEDTNAFVVRQDTADTLGLTKMSQLAAVQDAAQVGPPGRLRHEPALRGCARGVRDHLSAEAARRRSARATCRWPRRSRARRSTSPSSARPSQRSSSSASSSLEDDLDTQPAENIAPLVRDDYLAKVDKAAFQALLDAASAKMTTEELTTPGRPRRRRPEGHRGCRQASG